MPTNLFLKSIKINFLRKNKNFESTLELKYLFYVTNQHIYKKILATATHWAIFPQITGYIFNTIKTYSTIPQVLKLNLNNKFFLLIIQQTMEMRNK